MWNFHHILAQFTQIKTIKEENISTTMETAFETPTKTPNVSANSGVESVLSTPLFVPPTPMLKELGYGTGKC